MDSIIFVTTMRNNKVYKYLKHIVLMVRKSNLVTTIALLGALYPSISLAEGNTNRDDINVVLSGSEYDNRGTVDVMRSVSGLFSNPDLYRSSSESYFPFGGSVDDACYITHNEVELQSNQGGNEKLYRSAKEYVADNMGKPELRRDLLIGVNHHGRIETILNPIAIDTDSRTAVFNSVNCDSLGYSPIPKGCGVWSDGVNTYTYDSKRSEYYGTEVLDLSDRPRISRCLEWK